MGPPPSLAVSLLLLLPLLLLSLDELGNGIHPPPQPAGPFSLECRCRLAESQATHDWTPFYRRRRRVFLKALSLLSFLKDFMLSPSIAPVVPAGASEW